ncbi:hypothetical protein Q8A67_006339 [Cirrhinus molitorella]|uniref:Uncharacterized protein n=1 Tax=Cirrhinus molitorella TaxID=172907 RepID=A0AA88Q901_9TELE|nr:hypothetical protein Q8A67_006339 [Cirrhinus molitorella]
MHLYVYDQTYNNKTTSSLASSVSAGSLEEFTNKPCAIKQEDIEQQIDLKEENGEIEELFEAGKKHQTPTKPTSLHSSSRKRCIFFAYLLPLHL